MARSSLFSLLQKAFHSKNISRRDFLVSTSLAAAGTGLVLGGKANAFSMINASSKKAVVVGGGLAGLNAAWQLQKAGVNCHLYEASTRVGGRVQTVTGAFYPGLVTELGGEFIDSSHEDLLGLCKEFALPLWDVGSEEKEGLVDQVWVQGKLRTAKHLRAAFHPFEEATAREIKNANDAFNRQDWATLEKLDRETFPELLDRIGMNGWFRDFIEAAYQAEFGIECREQSGLNLLFLFDPKVLNETGEAFGESDERYKIQGGNQRLPEALAARVKNLHLGRPLKAVRAQGTGYELVFGGPAGEETVQADHVVLAVPFTALRKVSLDAGLDANQRLVIGEIGYGQYTKVVLGMRERFWRKAKTTGELMQAEGNVFAWDSSRFQPGKPGTLTFFTSGQHGRDMGEGAVEDRALEQLALVKDSCPKAARYYTGHGIRMDWCRHPWSEGAYACTKVGQWVPLARFENRAGNLHFAGEHLAREFQGFMNGALRSGREAAEAIVATMQGEAKPLLGHLPG